MAKKAKTTLARGNGSLAVRPRDRLKEPRPTLAQKLVLFNPRRHGGEILAIQPVGHEKI